MEDFLGDIYSGWKHCHNHVSNEKMKPDLQSIGISLLNILQLKNCFSVGRGDVYGRDTFLNKQFTKRWDIYYVGYACFGQHLMNWRNIFTRADGPEYKWFYPICSAPEKGS